MPKRRANGEGNIRKRKDGRWEGRYTAGYDANGKAITKNVLGKTQAEVKDKLRTRIYRWFWMWRTFSGLWEFQERAPMSWYTHPAFQRSAGADLSRSAKLLSLNGWQKAPKPYREATNKREVSFPDLQYRSIIGGLKSIIVRSPASLKRLIRRYESIAFPNHHIVA